MSFRRAAKSAGISLVLFASVAVLATGCGSSSSSTGTGGKTGAAGAGAGGKLGLGGAGMGGMIVDAGPIFPQCTPFVVQTPALLDFNAVDPAATQAQFGDFSPGTFSGGTYQYPAAITSTFAGSWHMTGTVADYSGFGIYLACKSDFSAFTGIQMDIGGTFTGNGMGDGGVPTPRVSMGLTQPSDDFDSFHAAMPPTWGTCTVGCSSPFRTINITSATPVTVTLPWTSFSGGIPVGALDPSAITGIFFSFPWNGAGSSQYAVDVTIGNISFTGGSAPPPVDSGTGTVDSGSATPDAAADTAATD